MSDEACSCAAGEDTPKPNVGIAGMATCSGMTF